LDSFDTQRRENFWKRKLMKRINKTDLMESHLRVISEKNPGRSKRDLKKGRA
jgi:hypothetical protein